MTWEDTQKKTKFVTMFPETENVHLIKDVGMIPYIMYKNFDFDAVVVTYQNGEYPYLDREVKGLKLGFLDRTYNDAAKDGCKYLEQHAREIDILHVFHLLPRTYDWINTYKKLNPAGKVYLKLDANASIKHINIAGGEGTRIVNVLKKCHLISVETRDLYKYLNENWPLHVEYLPNGFYECAPKRVEYQQKEDIILTVGRIGATAKASEVLLEAFKLAHVYMPTWRLKFVGPVMPGFQKLIDDYFAQTPELRNKVIFTNEIIDRACLRSEYEKAKIFCLTSRWEGFPIVFPEAAVHGCYIIATDLAASWDITGNKQYGDIFSIDDSQQLAQLLIKASNDEVKLQTTCMAIQDFARENFYWGRICQTIYEKISHPLPSVNHELNEIRKLVIKVRQSRIDYDPAVDQFLIERLETYPVALKLSFWERHSEFAAVKKYPELAGVLLDFGCGSGHMDILLAREGRQVHGIDISPLGIEIGNYFRAKEAYEVQERVSFAVADVTAQRTDDRQFDCVLAVQVIEYISSPEPIFRGLRNWVKDGAYMLISVSSGNANYDPRKVHHYANATELENFLSRYITVVRVDPYNGGNILRALCRFDDGS